MKNFSKYKSGVSHYHSGVKGQSGMIINTFLLPCKNDPYKPHFPPFMSNSQINQLSLTQRTDKNRPSEEPF